jgi:hypothetical protein
MGREIRRVPADWEHPRDSVERFMPMRDEPWEDAVKAWDEGHALWERGEHKDQQPGGLADGEPPCGFDEWHGERPAPEDYRPAYTSEPTHYQAYETVSEGTPVSPVFATLAELADWMCQPIDRSSEYNRGADWQCMQGKTREVAESFTRAGHAFSGVMIGGQMMGGVDAGPLLDAEAKKKAATE